MLKFEKKKNEIHKIINQLGRNKTHTKLINNKFNREIGS